MFNYQVENSSGNLRKEKDINILVLQNDKVLRQEMKEKISSEYFRRVKVILGSQLNAHNAVTAINYRRSIIRYSAGIVDWNRKK